MTLPLPTARLSFRQLTADDLDFLAALLSHPEVMRYYPKPLSRPEALAWIERQCWRYQTHGHGLWLITERQTGAPVGQVGLVTQVVDDVPEPEVGYLLHHPFWHLGYATEAAAAVRDHAFSTLNYSHVISLVRPVNTPSQAVARRIGMDACKTTQFAGLEHLVFEGKNIKAPSERQCEA